jgi:SAM-dependent methyltransferase
MGTIQLTGLAAAQGDLWSSRAADWATIQEPQHRPLYEAVFDEAGLETGTELLDVGCGAGVACHAAVLRGAAVVGIDAAEALIKLARERVPGGEFKVADMQAMPFPDESFDVVTGFNAFSFAADPRAAIGEARRVTRPGGRVAVVVMDPARSDLTDVLTALRDIGPPSNQGPGPLALSGEGVLEAIAEGAGQSEVDITTVACPFVYPDEASLVRAVLSAGPAVGAARALGESAVREATVAAVAGFRQQNGSYRLENTFRSLILR